MPRSESWTGARESPCIPSATWTVLARRASAALHGIGPRSAQLTLKVELSYWKSRRFPSARSGTVPGGSIRSYSAGAPQSARTARRAAKRRPSAASAALALPPRTSIRSIGVSRRSSPPRARSRSPRAGPAEAQGEEAAAGALGGEVGVQRVAGEQPTGALAAEALVGQAPRRQQAEAGGGMTRPRGP